MTIQYLLSPSADPKANATEFIECLTVAVSEKETDLAAQLAAADRTREEIQALNARLVQWKALLQNELDAERIDLEMSEYFTAQRAFEEGGVYIPKEVQ
jgi:hypothetical protein